MIGALIVWCFFGKTAACWFFIGYVWRCVWASTSETLPVERTASPQPFIGRGMDDDPC